MPTSTIRHAGYLFKRSNLPYNNDNAALPTSTATPTSAAANTVIHNNNNSTRTLDIISDIEPLPNLNVPNDQEDNINNTSSEYYTLPSIDNHGNMTMVVTSIHDSDNENNNDAKKQLSSSIDQDDDDEEEEVPVCFCSPIVSYFKNILGSGGQHQQHQQQLGKNDKNAITSTTAAPSAVIKSSSPKKKSLANKNKQKRFF